MSFASASTPKAATKITRPNANFRPSIWGDTFLQYDSESSMEVNESMNQQIEAYKEKVKKMFLPADASSINVSQTLNLIDSIQRLGISYHFEHEINEALQQIHHAFKNNNLNITDEEEAGSDLHSLALLFRLLRKNGYQISSDIFKKFKNNQGKFNDMIVQDVQGMWSLYEAAQLRVHGEDILEEALDFTYTNLKSMINQLSPPLAALINQSLMVPIYKVLPRTLARCYISFYEQDPSHSKVLLNFAKLDFNMLQIMHQKEVGRITKWWKKSDCATKVPYARDRVVEGYFWAYALASYEPKHSITRMMMFKILLCTSLLDDTYDAYGTLEELELFTQAIQRWDTTPIESLPECFRVVFNTCVEFCDEIESTVTAKGGESCMVLQHVKQAIVNLVQAYIVEARWRHEGYIPTYDEYKDNNGYTTSTGPIFMTTCMSVGEFATKEVFDWIFSDSKVLKAASLVCRLLDDTGSHKFEQERGDVVTGVECCMKQYNTSQEEAYKIIYKDVNHFWKDINEGLFMRDDNIPKAVYDFALNFAIVSEFTYSNNLDRYTNPELMKDAIDALLLNPIVI